MGQMISLTAADGHSLGAYQAEPAGTPKGGLVVIQEIFGMNGHMRRVCDSFAKEGYLAIGPALFDRIERDVALDYNEDDYTKGRALRGQLTEDAILADVAAAAEAATGAGKVAVIGYCFGGFVAWLAGCNLDGLACSIGLYGGGIAARAANDTPKCPVQLHFGDKDMAIPLAGVDTIREAHPDIPIFVYDDAGHGFCCDDRDSFNPDACARATRRALDFVVKNMA